MRRRTRAAKKDTGIECSVYDAADFAGADAGGGTEALMDMGGALTKAMTDEVDVDDATNGPV